MHFFGTLSKTPANFRNDLAKTETVGGVAFTRMGIFCDRQSDGRTDRRTYRTNDDYPLHVYGLNPRKLTQQAPFNTVTSNYPNPNLTKHSRTDCIAPLCTG